MQIVKHVVISAAGIGSRLGMNIPKCLVHIAGRRIIEYQLELLKDIEDVRVVVGFHEEEVIHTVSKFNRDIIFVRNPQFAFTSTMQSIWLAVKELNEPFIIIDGDTIIDPKDFRHFCEKCIDTPLIGITKSSTEDAVYVETTVNKDAELIIHSFNRDYKKEYEWTGIAFLDKKHLLNENMYVYKSLERFLPLKAHVLQCLEIDTQQDLTYANKVIHSEWTYNIRKGN